MKMIKEKMTGASLDMLSKLALIALISFVFLLKVSSQCFVDTAKLNQSLRNLKSLPTSYELEKAFFDAFPSSWMEFHLTYQWYPNKDYDLGYMDHIETFGNLKLIPDTTYCDKLISLCVGGKWEADATSALQQVLHDMMGKKADVFFSRLSLHHRGFQLRFWQYYWSSITHPEDNLNKVREDYPKECDLLKRKMTSKYPNEVKTMEIAMSYSLGEINFETIENNFPHGYFVKQ